MGGYIANSTNYYGRYTKIRFRENAIFDFGTSRPYAMVANRERSSKNEKRIFAKTTFGVPPIVIN